jgi:hypothetical protein
MSDLRQRKHHSKSHRHNEPPSKRFENYITQHFFMLLGIAFFIAGALFLVRMAKPGQSLFSTILSFFTTAGAEETGANTVFPFNGWKVLIQMLPGFALLILPFIFYDKRPAVARMAAIAGTFWVFGVHIKVLSYDIVTTSTSYPTLLVAMGITLGLAILPLWHGWKLKNSSLQVLTVILFFISLLFLTNDYQWHYYQDFLFLLFFTGLIILLCFTTGKLAPYYLQAFLSILMVFIFWIRRMVMRDSGDLVSTYIIISTLFYSAFFVSGIAINLSKRNVIWELAASMLLLVNTFFFWGSVLYVLQKYGYSDYQGLFTLVLVIFNAVLLWFSPKINPGLFRNPYVFLTLVLAAMILPLWAQQNHILLFASVFSVLLLFYSNYSKNRLTFMTSVAFVAIMLAVLTYQWVRYYIPCLYSGVFPAGTTLFYHGFQAGLFTLFALFFNSRLIKTLEVPVPGKWFSRRTYRMILKSFLFVAIYVTGFWCWHFVFSYLFSVSEAMLLSWSWFTTLFLILLILYLENQQSKILRPVFGLTALTLLAFPLLVNYSLVAVRDMGILNGGEPAAVFIAHLFLLPLYPALIAVFYLTLRKAWVKKKVLMRLLHIFVIGLGLSWILMEYDHLTVFFGLAGAGNIAEMVFRNHHLPYSLILIIFSVVLITLALIRKHRFIRQLAILLLLAALAKILVFDFEVMGETGRIILLFILGAFLVAFSFLYRRFRKIAGEKRMKNEE